MRYDDRPNQMVLTHLGHAYVWANGDAQYAFTLNGMVNRVPVEAAVRATVRGTVYTQDGVDIRRTDKAPWDYDFYGKPVSESARAQIENAAKGAILSVASSEFDRLGTLARRRLQLEAALEGNHPRRRRLVEALSEAQAALDAFDADIVQIRKDIERLEHLDRPLTPTV